MLLSILCCGAYADTINLHWLNEDGTTYQNSTCTVDSDLNIPTTPPTKYGYTFTGWKIANYIPIEYLESTGTQWIDTGVVPTNTTSIDFEFAYTVLNGNQVIFGSRTKDDWYNSNDQMFISCSNYSDGIYMFSGTSKVKALSGPISGNTFYKIVVNNSSATSTSTQPISLYALNDKGTFLAHGKIKMKYVKIYDNDILIRDFIPVLDYNGVPCMYDKVEGKFYYNQGTGQFIAGPVLQ